MEEGTEQGYFELFASLSFVDHEFDTLQKQAEQLERTLPMNSGFTVMEDVSKHTYTHVQVHAHICTHHAHTHTCTHAHTRAHTPTHTHTHMFM